MPLTFVCHALGPEEEIPVRFTCEGEDISPALSWQGAPPGTAAFALVVDDPDAPKPGFTHWVLYNLPSSVTDLPEGLPAAERLDNGGLQGKNDFGDVGYSGPCPPPGPAHRYRFRLFSLDETLDLRPGANKDRLLEKMRGHVLAEAAVTGFYRRRQVASMAI